MTPLTLIATRYQANNRAAPARLAQQVRYVGRAPLFDRRLETHSVAEARTLLAAHGLSPEWNGDVSYHRIVLSLRNGQGLDETALLRVLTMVALDDLGRLLDRQLVWIGGVHEDTDNIHAHVLIAGGDMQGHSVEIRSRALATFKQRVEERARALSRRSF